MINKIFLDLDGVLADFDTHYLASNAGVKVDEKTEGSDVFWDVVLRTPDFWFNIPVMEGARKLWNHLTHLGIPVEILSSPAEVVGPREAGLRLEAAPPRDPREGLD